MAGHGEQEIHCQTRCFRARATNQAHVEGPRTGEFLPAGRILLKADQAERGEAWKDEWICAALDTNIDMVARVREVFIEQGIEALTLTRK